MSPALSIIPAVETGVIQSVVWDYLADGPTIQGLAEHKPNWEGLENSIEARKEFPIEHRLVLAESLKRQYQECDLLSDSISERIELLLNSNTFTITTGQQLGIFLGPLYTTMKILSAVSLANELKKRHPKSTFIPVFWMATEDHDIEEINHVVVDGKKYLWNTKETGPSGELSTHGLDEMLGQLVSDFPALAEKEAMLRKYVSMPNLSAATRVLVHDLFGDLGVLIIDANRPELKQLFAPIIEKDILHQESFQASRKAIQQLEQHYHVQVNGREVNFFYMQPNYRDRIEAFQGGFSTVDRRFYWSKEDMSVEIKAHPESFSPNVMMRPVYQECILPNIAYFGGGAEIAYWLELKDVFITHHQPFPVLLLRNSGVILDAVNHHRFINSQMNIHDIFLPQQELEKKFVLSHSAVDLTLTSDFEHLETWMVQIQNKSKQVDSSLERSAIAFTERMKHQLNNLSQKLIREAKKKERVADARMLRLHQHVFPGGSLQERKESYFTFFLRHGNGILADLMTNHPPLGAHFIVVAY